MKILMIAMNINEHTNQDLATPFGLLYISAFTRQKLNKEISFKVIDGNSALPDEDYDLAAISVMSLYYSRAEKLAQEIKTNKNIPIIIGGPHATWLPHKLSSIFDIAVIGEGEETFAELVDIFYNNSCFPEDLLENINGIAYKKNNGWIINQQRDFIMPLDRIPYPDRDLWDLRSRVKWIISSRGCPYGCIFCSIAKTRYRQNSVRYFIDEVINVKESYETDIIAIQDDLFCISKSRLREISQELEEKGQKGKILFAISMRADQIDEEMVQLLKNINIIKVFMGAESGSENILQYYKDGKITVPQIQKALDICFDYGIKVEGSFIIGAPDETVDDLKDTYNFIFNNYKCGKLGFAAINILTPFPGSSIWEYAKKEGIVSDDFDWTRLDLNLRNFDPYRCVYLNKKIPLLKFVDYIEIFEELNYITTGSSLSSLRNKPWSNRLDKNRLKQFKKDINYH